MIPCSTSLSSFPPQNVSSAPPSEYVRDVSENAKVPRSRNSPFQVEVRLSSPRHFVNAIKLRRGPDFLIVIFGRNGFFRIRPFSSVYVHSISDQAPEFRFDLLMP